MSAGGRPSLRQLVLPISPRDPLRFDTYVPGPNAEVVATLQALAARPWSGCVYLWGPAGTGKTHLLHALCHAFPGGGRPAWYVPLGPETAALAPAVLEIPRPAPALLCVDDLQAACGDAHWEHALFHAFNAVRDEDGVLVFAARESPAALALGLGLADLASRLRGGLTLHLRELADEAKREVLQRRAAARGLDLPDNVADYMLSRLPRDLARLLATLDSLDAASLAAQRRLTVPFVRGLIDAGGAGRADSPKE